MVVVWVREPIGQGASGFQREVIAALEAANLSGSAYVSSDLPDMLIFVLGGAAMGWKLRFRQIVSEGGSVAFEVEEGAVPHLMASTLEELMGILHIWLVVLVERWTAEMAGAIGFGTEITSPRPSGTPLSVP